MLINTGIIFVWSQWQAPKSNSRYSFSAKFSDPVLSKQSRWRNYPQPSPQCMIILCVSRSLKWKWHPHHPHPLPPPPRDNPYKSLPQNTAITELESTISYKTDLKIAWIIRVNGRAAMLESLQEDGKSLGFCRFILLQFSYSWAVLPVNL